jgi:putative membrane protein
MRTRTLLMTATILGTFTFTAFNAYAHGTSTQDFVTKASIANEFEIESSQVALEKSHNGKVKKLAQRMIDDHTQTSEKLGEVLAVSNSKAQPADGLDDKHEALLETLENTPDSDFDSKYLSIQADAHKKAVKLFGDYAQHGKEAEIKDFASQTLPTLQDHLKHVQKLKAVINP